MAKPKRTKTKSPKIENAVRTAATTDRPVQNGLASAMGLPNPSAAGFPWNQGSPYTSQLSQTTTIFKNLRYYLISNFRPILNEAYVELGLVQTIVDVPVDDSLRGGIEIRSKQLDEDELEELKTFIDREDDLGIMAQAMKWTRLFGGGGVLIITDQDCESPIDLEALGPDSPVEFRAVDLWELTWNGQNTQGYDPEVEEEVFDYYNYYGRRVHKSRVLKMTGLMAPSFIRPRLRGWGFSVVEVLVRSINQYLKATDLSFEVLDEFKVDFYKIKNLVNSLMSPGAEQKIRERIELANMTKSYQRAVVMDGEDEWDHRQLSFSGLAETMSQIRMQVASDMRMPIIKLFGQSVSAGLGNSAQEEMENYNAMVESQVRSKMKKPIITMLELRCQQLFGFVPDDLSIEFSPLRTLTAEQEENVKTQKFNRALALKTAGEITRHELRETVNKGKLLDITLDTAGDELNPEDPDIEALTSGEVQTDEDAESDAPVPEGQEKKPKAQTEYRGENPEEEEGSDQKRKTRPGGEPTNEAAKNKEPRNMEPKSRVAAIRNGHAIANELIGLGMKNSVAFDVEAYVMDGGDAQFDPRREPFFTNPRGVDQGLWSQAVARSQEAFGKVKWQFVAWYYRKQGGKMRGPGL